MVVVVVVDCSFFVLIIKMELIYKEKLLLMFQLDLIERRRRKNKTKE
jgi:hypothetical protein